MSFGIFAAAAILTGIGLWLAGRSRSDGSVINGARPEGAVFVFSILLVALLGFVFHVLSPSARLLDSTLSDSYTTPESITARPLYPAELFVGVRLFLLAFAVYLLSAIRGLGRFPAWLADIIVIGCAFVATRASQDVAIQITTSSSGDASVLPLSNFGLDTLLTVGWVWLVSRLCASLNRVPAAAGGYLGLFGLTLALLLNTNARSQSFFPEASTSALAGAGLAAFVLGLRFPQINLGWSSLLAMGFLLGTSSAMGLLKNTLPAIIGLGILALGLPLINVSIVTVRARLRGYNVNWSSQHMRLDQALAARGVPARKIAVYYFSVGAWLCLLAFLSTRWFFGDTPGVIRGILYAFSLLLLALSGAIVFFSLARLQMRRQPDEDVPESVEAFGVKISPVSMEEALDKIEEFIASRKPHQVLTSDANAILTSKNDPDYAAIMRKASLTTPDGFGVIWGARLLNLPIYERVTGVDMVTGICERAARHNYSIFILGSEEGVAATAARNLLEKYPGMRVVGTHHGFWRRDGKEAGLTTEEADIKMADEIRRANPDVLFVAMGIPMQEKFIAAQLERMNVPVSLGVGGSFDVYAGKFNRAPQYIQRVGLEWLYRVWIDPSRWKRMGYVPRFMIVALREWLFGPRNGKSEAF